MSCIETSRKYEAEIKKAFTELFPLADDRDLPSYPSHIPDFLKKRLALEVEERCRHLTSRIVRILCEVTHPKTHIEDMVRAAVEKAKATERVEVERDRVKLELVEAKRQFSAMTDRLNEQAEQIKQLQIQNRKLEAKAAGATPGGNTSSTS
jgi:hypothetical protein